jgi:hypothetical protein
MTAQRDRYCNPSPAPNIGGCEAPPVQLSVTAVVGAGRARRTPLNCRRSACEAALTFQSNVNSPSWSQACTRGRKDVDSGRTIQDEEYIAD